MEIIIEESLIINMVVIFCILRFTSVVTRQKGKYYFLSSLCGSIITCACPAFNLIGWIKYLVLFCTISLLNLTVFKYQNFKKFSLNYCVILLSTLCIGGGCLALQTAIGRFPIMIVCVVSIFLYLAVSILLKAISHNNNLKKFTFKLVIKDQGIVVEEEGYLDSGNVLYDTLTNKPIVLVNYEVFKKFYDVDYLNARLQRIDKSSIKNAHYIKINGIGKGTSMLVFTVDELTVEDKYYQNVSLGLSFSGFEKSFGKNILLHCDYV